jgi:hypothetical protein
MNETNERAWIREEGSPTETRACSRLEPHEVTTENNKNVFEAQAAVMPRR